MKIYGTHHMVQCAHCFTRHGYAVFIMKEILHIIMTFRVGRSSGKYWRYCCLHSHSGCLHWDFSTNLHFQAQLEVNTRRWRRLAFGPWFNEKTYTINQWTIKIRVGSQFHYFSIFCRDYSLVCDLLNCMVLSYVDLTNAQG